MSSDDHDHADESTALGKLETAVATALAAGVGISAASNSAAAQETQEVVLQASDYYPNEEFVVLTDFEERNRVEFLEEYDDDEEAFDDHDDWEVYSALIEVGEPAGKTVVMMIDNDVDPDPGDRGTMGDSPSFHDYEWNLIEVDVTFDDDDDENEIDDDENDDDDENEVNDDENDNDENVMARNNDDRN